MDTSQEVLLIVLVAHLFLPSLNAYLAREKGRKENSWFFITFFFGFFATILLLLADKVGQPSGRPLSAENGIA